MRCGENKVFRGKEAGLLINGSGKSTCMHIYVIYMHTSIGVYICMYTHTYGERKMQMSNKWAKRKLVRKFG